MPYATRTSEIVADAAGDKADWTKWDRAVVEIAHEADAEIERLRAKLEETDRQLTAVEHLNAKEKQELRADRDLWEARCCAAFWLIPGEVKCGDLQDAAKRAAELLSLERTIREHDDEKPSWAP